MKFVPRAARKAALENSAAGSTLSGAPVVSSTMMDEPSPAEVVMGPSATKSLVQLVAESKAKVGEPSAAYAGASELPATGPGAILAGSGGGAAQPRFCPAVLHAAACILHGNEQAAAQPTAALLAGPYEEQGFTFAEQVHGLLRTSNFVVAHAPVVERRRGAGRIAGMLAFAPVRPRKVCVVVPSRDVELFVRDEASRLAEVPPPVLPQPSSEPTREDAEGTGQGQPSLEAGRLTIVQTSGLTEMLDVDSASSLREYDIILLVDVHLLRLRDLLDAWAGGVNPDVRVVALGDPTDEGTRRVLKRLSMRWGQLRMMPSPQDLWSGIVHTALFASDEMKPHVLLAALQRTPPPAIIAVARRSDLDEVNSVLRRAGIRTDRGGEVSVWLSTAHRTCRGARHVINYGLPGSSVATTLTDRVAWLDPAERANRATLVTTLFNRGDPPHALEDLAALLQRAGQPVPGCLQ